MRNLITKTSFGNGTTEVLVRIKVDSGQLQSGNHLKIELDVSDLDSAEESITCRGVSSEFKKYASSYSKKDHRVVKACVRKFDDFCVEHEVPDTPFNQTECTMFRDYLYDELHGNTPGNYFKKFRMFLGTLVEEGKISDNPAHKVKLHFEEYSQKQSLAIDDLRKLQKMCIGSNEVLSAFLFACYTGLRWGDIKNLRFRNVDLDNRSIDIIQSKLTNHGNKARLVTYINKAALNILRAHKDRHIDNSQDECVFDLPSYSAMYRNLQSIIKIAGINKHITFHCARHTFISLLIANGIDIKTVADLAGHTTTKHTERYVHSMSSHLRESIEKLDICLYSN